MLALPFKYYIICHFVYLSRDRWKQWLANRPESGSSICRIRISCAVRTVPCGGFGFGRRLAENLVQISSYLFELYFFKIECYPSDMLSALKGRGQRRRGKGWRLVLTQWQTCSTFLGSCSLLKREALLWYWLIPIFLMWNFLVQYHKRKKGWWKGNFVGAFVFLRNQKGIQKHNQ